jgi:glycerol-3-phosphate dehydrogenase
MNSYDVIIIGGGVVGCMTARALSRFDIRVLLIEKNADIGMGASCANSAIIHSGHDPLPGTLKARMNQIANPMWDQLSAELGIPFNRTGAYVVALNPDEKECLNDLKKRAMANGVPAEVISGEEMRHREPKINPEVTGALFTPTAGLVDPFAACIAPLENAIINGVEVMLETEFKEFILTGNRVSGIRTSRGDFACRWVVNAAGIYSDDVMHKAGIRPEFKITPRKGEYYVLDQSEFDFQNILFPVPSAASKGIVVTGSTHGNPLIGPTSYLCPDREDTSVTQDGLGEVWQAASKLVPALNPRAIIAVFAGTRATGNATSTASGVDYHHDFVIEIPNEVAGVVNLAGIESPGLTAAPAIAERVVELLLDAGEKWHPKKDWNPIRHARPRFSHLSHEEQEKLAEANPSYRRVICRCELVTEGEILAEIHAPLPAMNYDAIKRRTWLGTGRCLGAFDMPRVVELLSREMGVSPLEITKKGRGSEFLFRRTKEVEEQQ